MYVKISFAVKNSVDISQIDKGIKRVIDDTNGDDTIALEIKKEFSSIISGLSMGKDSNGNRIDTSVTDVEVYADDRRTHLVSSWHDND